VTGRVVRVLKDGEEMDSIEFGALEEVREVICGERGMLLFPHTEVCDR